MHEDRKHMDGVPGAEVVWLKKSGGGAPLFLTYPVSGSVFCYTELVDCLTIDRPIYGIQSIGLDGAKLPPERLETMAWHAMASITRIQPAGPYYLAGWSFAGLVALEAAVRMRYAGLDVAFLCMMDTWSPPAPREAASRELDDVRAASLLAADLGDASGAAVDLSVEEVQRKGLFQQAVSIKKKTGGSYSVGAIEKLLRVYRANLRALEAYSVKTYPGAITYFRAKENRPEHRPAPLAHWKSCAEGGLDVIDIPCDHHHMLKQPHAANVASRLESLPIFEKTMKGEDE